MVRKQTSSKADEDNACAVESELREQALRLLGRREFGRQELEHRLASIAARRIKRNLSRRSSKSVELAQDCKANVPSALISTESSAAVGTAGGNDCAAGRVPVDVKAAARNVVAALEATGQVSDDRFVESFVRARVHRGQGPIRVRAELRGLGVDSDRIDRYLTRSTDYWLEQARGLLKKRPSLQSDAGKLGRFLTQKGFPSDIVARLVRKS